MTGKRISLLLLAICLWGIVAGICSARPAEASVDVHFVVPAPCLVMSADERRAGDVLLLAALAGFFGADVHIVVPLYRDWSIHDIVLILAICHHSRRDLDYAIGLRKHHGWGWGKIAHHLGVHPGAFNQHRVWAKKQDYMVGEHLLLCAIGGYWGIPMAHVRALRTRNYPAREMAFAANISCHSGKPLGQVLKDRNGKQSWTSIAQHHGVTESQLDKPVKAKGHFGSKASKGKPGPAKGKGKGKSKGKGKGHK